MTQVPVAEGLLAETPAGPRLLGSRCATCATPYFPKVAICRNPACAGGAIEDAEFGPKGTLWSYTIQYYPPPPPAKYDEPYVPYAMGMIDMAEGVRVLARVGTDNVTKVVAGREVELVFEKLYTAPDGNDVMTWKFREVKR